MPTGKSYRIKSGVLTRNHLRPSDCNVRQTAAGRQPRPVPLQNIATGLTCGDCNLNGVTPETEETPDD